MLPDIGSTTMELYLKHFPVQLIALPLRNVLVQSEDATSVDTRNLSLARMVHDAESAQPRAADDLSAAGEAALACNCCRKRKLRCSREVPICQQCRKTGMLSTVGLNRVGLI